METKKPVILIVEDEQPLANIIQAKLNASGFDTLTARTVTQALEYLESIKIINLIWLDHYLLGRENGLDLVIKVKNKDKWSKIPIFVISNTATADKKYSYLNLGIEKYYVKSDHRLNEIIQDITDLLKKKHE